MKCCAPLLCEEVEDGILSNIFKLIVLEFNSGRERETIISIRKRKKNRKSNNLKKNRNSFVGVLFTVLGA